MIPGLKILFMGFFEVKKAGLILKKSRDEPSATIQRESSTGSIAEIVIGVKTPNYPNIEVTTRGVFTIQK